MKAIQVRMKSAIGLAYIIPSKADVMAVVIRSLTRRLNVHPLMDVQSGATLAKKAANLILFITLWITRMIAACSNSRPDRLHGLMLKALSTANKIFT